MTRAALGRRAVPSPQPLREREAIARLARLLGAPSDDVLLGIGDDAAVLRWAGGRVVWTVDACVENVHFDRRWLTLADVGWRSFHAAVSDLGAMGARPVAALSSLVLPRGFGRADLAALGRGQGAAARALGCPVIGGNITSGDVLSVTTTALGAARRVVSRGGARPGDQLWLVGDVGLAAAGLRLLRADPTGAARSRAGATCVRAWRRPRALVDAGVRAAPRARAAIDVSDGLGGDVGQLAGASRVRSVIEQGALHRALRPELVRVAAALGEEPSRLALQGGEDYALVLAAGARPPLPEALRIGRVERGRGAVLELADGSLEPLQGGFEHGG